jgi:sporulation protein YlmC with PRC-barrel domain
MVTDVEQTPRLVKLGDTELTVSDPGQDIRGRTVIDRNGDEIGHVDALLIDEQERKVRFLQIASGGILGIGEQQFLLPVDAVIDLDDGQVIVDQTGSRVAYSPAYNPDLTYDRDYYGQLYGYYNYPRYWSAGYVYPPFPSYPSPTGTNWTW